MASFIPEALGATRMKYYGKSDGRKGLQRESLYVCMIVKARELLKEIVTQKV